ncbi:MAG: hypothetical protein WDA22_12920 [Bacteroidota bacterium]
MKTTNFFRTVIVAAISILVTGILFAGNVRNNGTIANSGTTTVTGYFENYKNAGGGIFNNTAGTYTVNSYFSQNNAGGTDGQATISGGNFVVGAAYTNDNGTTTNTATIKIAADLTNGGVGTFTTTGGNVEYNGAAAAQSVLATTYGGLLVTATGNKTLAGSATVNTTFTLSNGTLLVGANTLDIKSATVTSGGTLSAASGTVSYTGTGAQQVFATTYGALTMTSTAPATKTGQGAITINGVYNSDANTTFDVGSGNAFTTGGSSNLVASNLGTIKVNNTVTLGVANVGGTFDYTGTSQSVAVAQYQHLTLSGVTPAFAAGTFSVSGNMTSSAVPGFNAATIIHYNGSGAQTVAALNYKLLQFSEVGVKSITGAVTAAATLAANTAVDIAATNAPTLTIANGASLGVSLGSISNASILNIDGTGSVTLTSGNVANLLGANVNINAAGSSLTVTGDVDNEGTITNTGTITVN